MKGATSQRISNRVFFNGNPLFELELNELNQPKTKHQKGYILRFGRKQTQAQDSSDKYRLLS